MDSETRAALLSLAKAVLALRAQVNSLKVGNTPDTLQGLLETGNSETLFTNAIDEFIKVLNDGGK